MTRFPGLDLLRATAILWVMLFHAMTEGLGRPLRSVGNIGWMAVDLFFVLSGYLIASQLFKSCARGEPRTLGRFYRRRALRILPAYFVVVSLYACFPLFREAHGLQPLWQFITFTENLLIDYQHNKAFSHAWSLCVEEHFYVLFPLLAFGLIRARSAKLTIAICAVVFVGGLALRTYAWTHGLNGGLVLRSAPWEFVQQIYYPTHLRLDGLLAGVILAALQTFRPAAWSAATSRPYWLLAAGAAVFAAAVWIGAERTTFAAVVFGFPLIAAAMAFFVAAATSPSCVLSRVRIPGAQAIATITFSLYLSHKMTWHLVHAYAPALVPVGSFQAFLVYTVAAFGGAALLYFGVERPFLLLRTRASTRGAVGAALPAEAQPT